MELKPFDDVFYKRIFRIPDYQRGYAWKREQLVDFWEDLLNLDEGREHYTGMLTIKAKASTEIATESPEYWLVKQNYSVCDVVDGQQRLTTFVILIQCMVESFRALPEHQGKTDTEIVIADQRLDDVIGRYLFKEKPPEKVLRTHLFGYHEDNPSYEYLKRVIFGDLSGGPIEESFYTLNLDNAKRYFEAQLKPIGEEKLVELFSRLTQRMLFNVYMIDKDLDVFVAFETMNNRGKKLSNLELLKNRMIYLTTLFPVNEQRQDEIAEVRANINDSWKAVYKWLGYNKQNPLNDDDFLKGHWIIYFKYSRQMGDDYIRDLLGERFSPKRVYREYEANVALEESIELAGVEEGPSEEEDDAAPNGEALNGRERLKLADIAAYAKSLSEFARAWYETFFPDQSLPHSHLALKDIEWIEKLKRLGYTYFRPLIAAMLCRVDSEADRLALYQAVERFIFLAFRLGRSNSNYRSSVFYGLARQLYKGEIDSSAILDQIGRDLGWCFREDGSYETQHFSAHMHKLFDSRESYYSWQELHYFLFEYEAYLAANRGGHKIHWESFSKREKDKVSIEHIYPQTPENRSWKEAFPRSKKEQKALQNSLGNLLALSQSINSSLQNEPFDEKKRVKRSSDGQVLRAGYSNGSHSEIAVSEYTVWTPDTIKNRGLEMIRFMERRWSFSIASDTERLELLGLSFLNQAR